jgi:hypothetical protein
MPALLHLSDTELKDRAMQVLGGTSRSYVEDARTFAEAVIELLVARDRLEAQLQGCLDCARFGSSHVLNAGDYEWSQAYETVLEMRRERNALLVAARGRATDPPAESVPMEQKLTVALGELTDLRLRTNNQEENRGTTMNDKGNKINAVQAEEIKAPILVGDKWFFRTVTMISIGRVVWVGQQLGVPFVLLEDGGWVAETARFSETLADGKLNEFERVPGRFLVALGSLVDAFPWDHALPKESK